MIASTATVLRALSWAAVVPLLFVACSDTPPHLSQRDDAIGVPPISLGAGGLGFAEEGAECAPSDSCEDGDPCTENRCVEGLCEALAINSGACCEPQSLWAESFDGDGLAVDLSAPATSGAAWQVDTTQAASAPASLHFGVAGAATYDTGERVQGTATLPELTLPAGFDSALNLRVLAQVEPSPAFDRFWIEADALDDAGAVVETRTVLDKAQLPALAFTEFAVVQVPLTDWAGRRVVLRLRFDSMDGNNNAFPGVWVDDLELVAGCPILAACAEDADCDDGDACTLDACSAQGCVHDDSLCEEPVDPTGPCAGPDAPADCCTSDADCDDGDPATINTCEGATCTTTLNPEACSKDQDCDDDEVCTTDTCVDHVCQHAGTIGPDCCEPSDHGLANFDKGKLSGMFVTDNLETGIFWNVDKTRATSGDYSLYCGDPVTQSYAADERVKASATTPAFKVPKGGQTTVAFDVFKSTRGHRDYDVFQVFVLRNGALMPAWSSRTLDRGDTGGQFLHVEIPLDVYAGQEIQLRFIFDTVDTPPGMFEGVYFDTVDLLTVCE